MQFLRDRRRRNPEFRIIQARNGQVTLAPRHPQYPMACGFASIAAILEYLGYSHFVPGGNLEVDFQYQLNDGTMKTEPVDVGYLNSMEHLIVTYIDGDTRNNGQRHYVRAKDGYNPGFDDYFLNRTGTDLNRRDRGCREFFTNGQEYGLCDDIMNDIDGWIARVGIGCRGEFSGDCSCSPDAECGLYWFLNDLLLTVGNAGCNDARALYPDDRDEIDDIRKIIKAFVDNDIPLFIGVNAGRHWMVLIGYADLDASGLPETAITVDPAYRKENPHYLYHIIPNIHMPGAWHQNVRCSLNSICIWNQHLNGACSKGGWAGQLNNSILKEDFRVCPLLPSRWSPVCKDPLFGISVRCYDDGKLKNKWHRYLESPFVSEKSNIDCDRLSVRFNDGVRYIQSAVTRRYWFSDVFNSWYGPMTFTSDKVGRQGGMSYAIWDKSWKDDYWLVAQKVTGKYSKRRTTLELILNTGERIFVEIAPPKTYGIKIECFNDGNTVSSYFAEADTEVFDNTNFFPDLKDKACDKIEMEVNLGNNVIVSDAVIQRWGYKDWNGTKKWGQITSTWKPNSIRKIPTNLSGETRSFIWDSVWPDNYWVVADNVGAGKSEDRKTRIILTLMSGSNREIQIVPY
jgi:hypothetical protein